jgi:hypothetical protein
MLQLSEAWPAGVTDSERRLPLLWPQSKYSAFSAKQIPMSTSHSSEIDFVEGLTALYFFAMDRHGYKPAVPH